MYLAMTAQEFASCDTYPDQIAWMACQFSPYHKGLSNLPDKLPENSLLILSDMTPFSGHDIAVIRQQLFSAAESYRCSGILLDLLRSPEPETRELCRRLCQEPPCPVAIPQDYWEQEMHTPVFLPAVPLLTPLKEYLSPWKGKDIFLEFACEEQTVTVVDAGASISKRSAPPDLPVHKEESLHCTYRISVSTDHADFYLSRVLDDLRALQKEAETLGIRAGIGLYQQLGQSKNPQT